MRSIGLRSRREARAAKLPVVFVVIFFVFTLPHAMVVAPMRTRYDQFGKQMVRTALETCGPVETDAEVPADTRRIDLWFMPDRARESVPDHLGILGRIAGGSSTLEFFHNTPSGEDLAACLIKHGEFRHFLSLRKAPPPVPTQWVISSGRPGGGIEGLWLRPMSSWPPGIYEGSCGRDSWWSTSSRWPETPCSCACSAPARCSSRRSPSSRRCRQKPRRGRWRSPFCYACGCPCRAIQRSRRPTARSFSWIPKTSSTPGGAKRSRRASSKDGRKGGRKDGSRASSKGSRMR